MVCHRPVDPACALGLIGDVNGTCSDIDECSLTDNTCGDEATCENTEGSYLCHCKNGFIKNEINVCIDVNECANQSHTCSENEVRGQQLVVEFLFDLYF